MIKMHSIQKGSYCLYLLEMHDKMAFKNAFESKIYWPFFENIWYRSKSDGSTIHEIFWVTPDKTEYPFDVQLACIPAENNYID